MNMRMKGFTLIELLIVVAIIAILAAIAVPNFLEAQTRAKVSRVKADMRSAQIAVESYQVDTGLYPYHVLYYNAGQSQWDRGGIYGFLNLTTPIAYMTSTNLLDPFFPQAPADQFGDIVYLAQGPGAGQVSRTFNLVNIQIYRERHNLEVGNTKWVMISFGPDNIRGPIPGVAVPGLLNYARADVQATQFMATSQYDPTNGTASGGDILKWQQ